MDKLYAVVISAKQNYMDLGFHQIPKYWYKLNKKN